MDETSPERHEYRNGEIISMLGGSEVHSAIASNLLIYLGFLARQEYIITLCKRIAHSF